MHYVYLLKSIKNPKKTYVGYTSDVKERLEKHNSGGSVHTSFDRPWELISYTYFRTQEQALEFEKYLKIGSGHAFAKRHFW
jgi:putative endonuclease